MEKEFSEKAIVAADAVSNLANVMSRQVPIDFLEIMSRDHRTIQQAFTRICLQWIELVASDEYRHDLRNEDSHKIAKQLIENFKKENDNFNPSEFLRTI
jgi:FtsZ-binding cell division protein ZapB